MGINVWVKVVGFNDDERHLLNTLFRVNRPDGPKYSLWTPQETASPHVALIDVDSYEAGLELVSPSFNPQLKVIAIGAAAPQGVWCSFARPVDWPALVQALDALFSSMQQVDIDIFSDEAAAPVVSPPGLRSALLLGMPLEEGYYLRTRLALAGILLADEAPDSSTCGLRLVQRHYDLALVYVDPGCSAPWALVEYLRAQSGCPAIVMAVGPAPDWRAVRQAEAMGCAALLEVPFNPQQVMAAFQKV
jgi:hypothetical protein